MRPDALPDAGLNGGGVYGPLNDGGVKMPAAAETGAGIVDQAGRREEVLPAKVGCGARVLAMVSRGQEGTAETTAKVFLVECVKLLKVNQKTRFQAHREDGKAVLVTFAADDTDAIVLEIEMLDAEIEALGEPEARAVQQLGEELECALESCEEAADLGNAENDWKVACRFRSGEME